MTIPRSSRAYSTVVVVVVVVICCVFSFVDVEFLDVL